MNDKLAGEFKLSEFELPGFFCIGVENDDIKKGWLTLSIQKLTNPDWTIIYLLPVDPCPTQPSRYFPLNVLAFDDLPRVPLEFPMTFLVKKIKKKTE